MIKSALEIALERTKGIEVDKKSLAAHDKTEEGKRLTGKFLAGDLSSKELSAALTEAKNEEAEWLREGSFSVLAANLTLPQDESYKERLERVREGLVAVTGQKKQVSYLFEQVEQFFEQYLENQEQLIQALEKQFAPRLRQREQEMERQFGQRVSLNPAQDPEFSKMLKQHLGKLEAQYSEALKQAKDQLRALFQSR
ncbi:hypothetical protein B4O97_01970 [Marispirochaeta aestuarii]|uniref:Uncharacterized protein n=1 Tax=Marispirochaeta aestuarii TaxID=1963862 RepID=A0A1Y1S223_9SPIO|nr:DUF6657 family protein [Marispirochaeta aestuarii]ORC37793.1 hypothetical protein B4O97_01970 [Marispirochaeta aestuarii]